MLPLGNFTVTQFYTLLKISEHLSNFENYLLKTYLTCLKQLHVFSRLIIIYVHMYDMYLPTLFDKNVMVLTLNCSPFMKLFVKLLTKNFLQVFTIQWFHNTFCKSTQFASATQCGNFRNFSAFYVLPEINFWDPRSSKNCHLGILWFWSSEPLKLLRWQF